MSEIKNTPQLDRAAQYLESGCQVHAGAPSDECLSCTLTRIVDHRIAAALHKAENAAVLSGVQVRQIPCGCRCNSADDTRKDSNLSGRGFGLKDGCESTKLTSGPFEVRPGDMAPIVVNIYCNAAIPSQQHSVTYTLPPSFLKEVDWDAVLGLFHQPVEKVDGHVVEREDLEWGICDCVSVNCDAAGHSSPVVADAEAATSVDPALTVQEDGNRVNGAVGVEDASSPASSTPRFVLVGAHMYDRETNRVALNVASPALVSHLNNGADTWLLDWEDAK